MRKKTSKKKKVQPIDAWVDSDCVSIHCCNSSGQISDHIVESVEKVLNDNGRKIINVEGNNDTGLVRWFFEPECDEEIAELIAEQLYGNE